jgi:hypothetical protein
MFYLIVDVIITDFDAEYFKVLRLFRILRPLRYIKFCYQYRFISHNENMKFMVHGLLGLFPGIINVLFIITGT